jgi:hypothetical protein
MTTAAAGGKRAHLVPTPIWVVVLRALQLLVSIIVMALCAWGISAITKLSPLQLIPGNDAYGFAFFAFAWTFLYLLWLALSLTAVPVAYHIWAHLPLECLTVLFWLVAFALLARNSSDYSSIDDGSDIIGSPVRNFLNATYASAGLSALVWLLFIATLVHLSICVHKHLKTKKSSTTATANNAPVANTGAPVMQTAPQDQQGWASAAGGPPLEAPGHHHNNIPPQQPYPPQGQNQTYPPQGQNQAYPPQGNHPHGFTNTQPQGPPQQGYYPPQQNNGTGVDNMVSDPSIYGTYQQHGSTQPVSPQGTGQGFAPSPTPSPAPVLGQGHGHDQHAGAHELSTFRGDGELAELPSGSK